MREWRVSAGHVTRAHAASARRSITSAVGLGSDLSFEDFGAVVAKPHTKLKGSGRPYSVLAFHWP